MHAEPVKSFVREMLLATPRDGQDGSRGKVCRAGEEVSNRRAGRRACEEAEERRPRNVRRGACGAERKRR